MRSCTMRPSQCPKLGHRDVIGTQKFVLLGWTAGAYRPGVVRCGVGQGFPCQAELPLRHRAALAATAASRSFSRFSPRHRSVSQPPSTGRRPPVGPVRFIAFLVAGPRPFPLLWWEKRLEHALGQPIKHGAGPYAGASTRALRREGAEAREAPAVLSLQSGA